MNTAQFLIHNGELTNISSATIDHRNRAFRYGDSLFETIRLVNGQACFLENHYSRLEAGMKALKMKAPAAFSLDYFTNLVNMLAQRNGVNAGGVARLTVYRNSGGKYRPSTNDVSFILEIEKYEQNLFEVNANGYTVDIYSEMSKAPSPFAMYKTGNSLLYIMAALYAQEHNLDDCILTNHKGSLLEATSSNLFIVSNGVLYTPSLDDGCVAGTMRMKLINVALANNVKVYECSLNAQNLLAADEMFLSNSVTGITWVKSYKNKRYFNKTAKFLIEKLNESILGASAVSVTEPAIEAEVELPGESAETKSVERTSTLNEETSSVKDLPESY